MIPPYKPPPTIHTLHETRIPVTLTQKNPKHPKLVASLRVKEESNADPYVDPSVVGHDIHTLARYTLARLDDDGTVYTLLVGRETWGHDAMTAIAAARGLLELELEGCLDEATETFFRGRQRLPLRPAKDRALRALLVVKTWDETRRPWEMRHYRDVTLYTATYALHDREGRVLFECSSTLGQPLVNAVKEAQEAMSIDLSCVLARADESYFTQLLAPVSVTPGEIGMRSVASVKGSVDDASVKGSE